LLLLLIIEVLAKVIETEFFGYSVKTAFFLRSPFHKDWDQTKENILYCLFFNLGHVSGGRVTVTDGKLQDIFTIMNMSLLNG
jgi:hypothetical protein